MDWEFLSQASMPPKFPRYVGVIGNSKHLIVI